MENTQRTIKFRAWNEEEGMFTDASKIFVAADSSEPLERVTKDEYLRVPLLLEQFTGLLDKNGTAIYEGDILAWRSEYTEKVDIAVVFWDRATARFDWKMPGLNFNQGGIRHFEVIGNIHENPDLIESGTSQNEA